MSSTTSYTDRVITRADISAITGVSASTIRRRIIAGDWPAPNLQLDRTGGRWWASALVQKGVLTWSALAQLNSPQKAA